MLVYEKFTILKFSATPYFLHRGETHKKKKRGAEISTISKPSTSEHVNREAREADINFIMAERRRKTPRSEKRALKLMTSTESSSKHHLNYNVI